MKQILLLCYMFVIVGVGRPANLLLSFLLYLEVVVTLMQSLLHRMGR